MGNGRETEKCEKVPCPGMSVVWNQKQHNNIAAEFLLFIQILMAVNFYDGNFIKPFNLMSEITHKGVLKMKTTRQSSKL